MHPQYKVNATTVPFLNILLIPSPYSCFPHNKRVYLQQKYSKNKLKPREIPPHFSLYQNHHYQEMAACKNFICLEGYHIFCLNL